MKTALEQSLKAIPSFPDAVVFRDCLTLVTVDSYGCTEYFASSSLP